MEHLFNEAKSQAGLLGSPTGTIIETIYYTTREGNPQKKFFTSNNNTSSTVTCHPSTMGYNIQMLTVSNIYTTDSIIIKSIARKDM